jgi:hypothetical protein
MKFAENPFKKLTLLKAAGYIFMFAVCAKGVELYATQHPLKEELLSVSGIVEKVRIGGEGRATWFRIQSGNSTLKCSSYYGKVWPGMDRIDPGDRVSMLLERNKLNRNELISGKQYYIWELIHHNSVVVAYQDIRDILKDTEATENQFINGFLAASLLLLIIAYLKKRKKGPHTN